MSPSPHPDSITDCALETFDALPPKFKPRHLAGGKREWVPLAAIVLSRGEPLLQTHNFTNADNTTAHLRKGRDPASTLTCAALATGMKCLPRSKIPLAQGNVLHDWHAEVLAIRAFNRWLVDECAELTRGRLGSEGAWVRWIEMGRRTAASGRHPNPPFELNDDVRIHMYCSEAPCGDASMELTMASQDDDTPWESQLEEEGDMPGRGHFDHLGIVRRKPARPDAPICWSKSCSDKLALKQVTGLLSGMTSLLILPANVYLDTVVLPESQCVPEATERAFGATGRMKGMGEWAGKGGYAFRPFEVKTTTREFDFSRRGTSSAAPVSSNLSAACTSHGRREVLINGVLQGRKQFDPHGASCFSRRLMWKSVLDLAVLAGLPALASALGKRSYGELKESDVSQERKSVKRCAKEVALKGWKSNDGDEGWSLDPPTHTHKQS